MTDVRQPTPWLLWQQVPNARVALCCYGFLLKSRNKVLVASQNPHNPQKEKRPKWAGKKSKSTEVSVKASRRSDMVLTQGAATNDLPEGNEID
ncbi:hypothetical protein [Shimia sediminis]|uniref:hypothetical protein n=1 Tax=Shimia sediminis TaxID=2497945 RepID=UPI000F8F09FC|nr:hypothetical protein [Shimia sediminis]